MTSTLRLNHWCTDHRSDRLCSSIYRYIHSSVAVYYLDYIVIHAANARCSSDPSYCIYILRTLGNRYAFY